MQYYYYALRPRPAVRLVVTKPKGVLKPNRLQHALRRSSSLSQSAKR
jgi:hypothetical protein